MGLFKKKEKEPEVFYDSKISFDGGLTFCTAEEAMPIIEKLKIWSKVYDSFDPKIFERVRKTSLEYTPLSVLKKYLSYSPNNIVMGKKKTDIWVIGDDYFSLRDRDFHEVSGQHETYYYHCDRYQLFQRHYIRMVFYPRIRLYLCDAKYSNHILPV